MKKKVMNTWIVSLVVVGFAQTAFAQSLDVMLAIEISPGTEQAIGLIRSKLFLRGERVGVVTIGSYGARVLQPLTGDHNAIDTALQKAGTRIGATVGSVQVSPPLQADLVSGVTQSCEAFTQSVSDSKRAVILLFGSDDPALTRQVEAVKVALSTANAHLYAIVIDRSALIRPNRGAPNVWTPHFPALTTPIISDIAEGSGGKAISNTVELKPILDLLRRK